MGGCADGTDALPPERQCLRGRKRPDVECPLPSGNRILIHRLNKKVVLHAVDAVSQPFELGFFGSTDLLVVLDFPVNGRQQFQQLTGEVRLHRGSPSLSLESAATPGLGKQQVGRLAVELNVCHIHDTLGGDDGG